MATNTGYDLLLAAGSSLTGTAIFETDDEPSDADLAQFLSVNREALDRARHALEQECAVPLEYNVAFFQKQADTYSVLRDLARSFAMELKAAERHDNLSGAVTIGLTICHLANATRRGGLIVDMLVTIALESIALERLRVLRRRLSPDDAIRLANELLRLEPNRESFDDIAARDRKWEEVVDCPDKTDLSYLDEIDSDEELKELLKESALSVAKLSDEEQLATYRLSDNRNLALMRLLAIESALVCFHARNGRYPADLSRLAPDCIVTLPLDPFTGTGFKYRKEPSGYVVYSPGPLGHDRDGTFGGWLQILSGEADLGIDMNDYEDF